MKTQLPGETVRTESAQSDLLICPWLLLLSQWPYGSCSSWDTADSTETVSGAMLLYPHATHHDLLHSVRVVLIFNKPKASACQL
jgi:hypothetical protein